MEALNRDENYRSLNCGRRTRGLFALPSGARDQREGRARQLLARMPEIVRAYTQQLQQELKVLANDRMVHDARETTRRLLIDGQIVRSRTVLAA